MNLLEIQQKIREASADGWLFYDIHHRDPISYRILHLDISRATTRRWFYFVPAQGQPIKLVHQIERNRIADLPGETVIYAGWQDLQEKLRRILGNCQSIFMQYSPLNNIPMISYADAGTVELIQSFGVKVLSAANLIQYFEARIDEEGKALHIQAGETLNRIKDDAFQYIMDRLKKDQAITELEVQQFIVAEFQAENLTCDGFPPMVAVNGHAADPHFDLTPANSLPIHKNDRVLIDLWAKGIHPKGIYADFTWCGFMGPHPPEEYQRMFQVVIGAREKAKQFIVEKITHHESIFGWQVDDVCRGYIQKAGYGQYFLHRTGHSIHADVHGNGVNLDNLETKDDREIIPGSCFSIEPGLYKDEIGVRTEINMLIDRQRNIVVVGKEQTELILMD